MSKTTLFSRSRFARKHARAAHAEEKSNGERAQRQQPLSDGSEEFFEEFTPESRGQQDHHTRDILVGLGVTVGVLLGVGATIWLRKKKGARGKWRKLFA